MTAQSSIPPSLAARPERPVRPKVSVEEYLERERRSEVRHEYVEGEIVAMAGETPAHNRIARNICVHLENAFGERPCESFIENIKVRVSPTRYRYPDVIALCGEPQFNEEKPPSLLNPAMLVEVLSPSTAEEDRGDKFREYSQLASVTDYVLVAQDEVRVIHYARQSATQWLVNTYSEHTDVLTFASLGESLSLTDIYRKVTFAAPAAPQTLENPNT